MAGKVSIIGAGNVGTAVAFSVAMDGTPDEVVLFDCNVSKAEGEIMDIEHASAFIPHTDFTATDSYDDVKDSDVVVITAGAKQGEGETRLDLLEKNAKIVASIMYEVVKEAPNAIIIMVTNPVDIMTYYAQKFSGFPAERVIGTGTVLDSTRFKSFLSKEFDLSSKNIHAYILGEHGDSSFPVLSTATVGAIPLSTMPGYTEARMHEIHKEVVTAAYAVIERKGSTNWAIGVCVQQLLRAILNDTREMYPVSSVLQGEYGIMDIALSTPSVVGKGGIVQRFTLPLNAEETKALNASAAIIRDAIAAQEHNDFAQCKGAWCPR